MASVHTKPQPPPPGNEQDEAGGDAPDGCATSAVERVFETYELAEIIYANLPLVDVLQAMQVNKTARDVIKSSKTIPREFSLLQSTEDRLHANALEADARHKDRFKAPFKSRIVFEHKTQKIQIVQIGTFSPFNANPILFCCRTCDFHTDVSARYNTFITSETDTRSEFWRRIRVVGPDVPVEVFLWRGRSRGTVRTTLEANATLGDLHKWLCEVMDRLDTNSSAN